MTIMAKKKNNEEVKSYFCFCSSRHHIVSGKQTKVMGTHFYRQCTSTGMFHKNQEEEKYFM